MRSERSAVALVLFTILLATAWVAGEAWAGSLIERTMAFVNKKPVLLSDVELAKALLKLEDKPAIERSIDESLMFQDASRLVNDPPPEAAVASAVAALREKVGAGFTAAALRRKALVELAISQYIELRLKPQVRIEDAQVRKVFNEQVLTDAQSPAFNLVADAIRESLERRALDQKVEEWVASLRRTEEIRRVPPRP